MVSLGEMHMFEAKRPFSSYVTPTYTDREAGQLDLSYQLEITVNANVPNQAKQEKLKTYVKHTLGYEECDIDQRNKTVRVYSVSGIDGASILEFIKKSIDKNATVRAG